jgi:predicted transcriptional regulator
MTLTVRLDPTLETALDRHCAATGVSKSQVVQESLAAYLMDTARVTELSTAHNEAPPSLAYAAFADVGLVGGVALALPLPGSADKAAVRAQVAARVQARRKPA